ncbi:MAG: dihydrodipicolinate synthase family protein [SAR324 cluster bacterium]|nr:dihydrodipicolinate synthase family protein [SAR324 cluster bacterium]
MNNEKKKGVWPVMVTPFSDSNQIDYAALEQLIAWYLEKGVSGLFAVCQSSEMIHLSLKERVALAKFVKETAGADCPVIASGHISESEADQIKEINEIAATGIDAFIFVTSRLARPEESEDTMKVNLEAILKAIPEDIPLGFYECPHPYLRLLSPDFLKWCVSLNRFHFLKDVSCNLALITEKIKVLEGSSLRIFNANSATILPSLQAGAEGFCGVMANFHPELYVWLLQHWKSHPELAQKLSLFLTFASLIERQTYPVNAKYYLQMEGLPIGLQTRTRDPAILNSFSFRKEIEDFRRFTKQYLEDIGLEIRS